MSSGLFGGSAACPACLGSGFGGPVLGCLQCFVFCGEFDPGSGRTLAACLTHASRTMKRCLFDGVD